jgi:hypothetical protein
MSPGERLAIGGQGLGLRVVDSRIVGVCGDGALIDVRQLIADSTPVDAASLSALLAAQQAESHP